MPGLNEANEYVSRLSLFLSEDIGPKGAYEILVHEGYGDLSVPTEKTVREILSNSQPHVQKRLANTLHAIRLSSRLVTDLEVNVEDALGQAMAGDQKSAERWKRRYEELYGQRSMWKLYLGFLRSQSVELHERTKTLERRQRICREEIEAFFGN